MRLLLDTGKVKIDVLDSDRRTPLSHAAEGGYIETVMALLAIGGVHPDSVDSNGRTPLSWAAESGYADVAKVLLGTDKVAPDTKDKEGKSPLSWAAKSGFAEVAKVLLATGKVVPDTPDEEGKTPLALAAGSSAYVSNVNARDISQDRAERQMVVKDIRRVLKGEEPLVPSIEAARRKEVPDDLLKHNPLEVMELLLQRDDVNPNSRTKIGQTPLMFAAQNRQIDAVRMLMNTGKMDMKLEDEDGWTALTYAERGYKPYKPTPAELDEAALDAWEASL
jgi:ankyrin repeat protein